MLLSSGECTKVLNNVYLDTWKLKVTQTCSVVNESHILQKFRGEKTYAILELILPQDQEKKALIQPQRK
jgi:hypothetical protein